jgi:flavodoxin I
LKQVGIFYGSSSGKTAAIATRIYKKIGEVRADLKDVEQSSPKELLDYDFLILGIPTWGIGKTQEDWDVLLPMQQEEGGIVWTGGPGILSGDFCRCPG